jgi:hypothetical protein
MIEEERIIAYQAPMLPQVDYLQMEEDSSFSLAHLEHQTMRDYCDFLEHLKEALIKQQVIQVPELVVAHLCAYLGTAITVHTVNEAERLEPLVIELIKHQAHAAYQHFNQYPINNTIKDHEQKKRNLEMLRETTPSSIIVQTIRFRRVIMDMLEELESHQPIYSKRSHSPEQSDLFCSQEILVKMTLLISSKKCAEWREQLDGFSDNFIINQQAIQIGWLIGYFSHLENRSPDETQYFDDGLPFIQLYREHVYQLMHTYARAVNQAQEEGEQSITPEDSEAEALLGEIHRLAEKTHAQLPPTVTDFQKQVAITQASIEKTVMELLMQKYSIKIILMSLFYFWFTLEAPMHAADAEAIHDEDAFLHMGSVIDLVKKTVRSLPKPTFTPEIQALNEKMQRLKRHLPHPEVLDKEQPANIEQQTAHINTTIHTTISAFINDEKTDPQAIAIVLFSHWMRLSVFFGVSESDWQKMDYYLPDILKAVREYLVIISGR